MKRTMLSLLIAATLSAAGSRSFANPYAKPNEIFKPDALLKEIAAHKSEASIRFKGEPEFKGSESFLKAFPNALVQNYETKGEITKVSFTWNGDALDAYYDTKGTLLATTHFLDSRTLPISILMKIRKRYDGYIIAQATEFYHTENGLSYFLIVKKDAKALILQVDPDGEISVLKKLKN